MTDTDREGALESVVPPPDAEYYGGVYWNRYAEVVRHMNRRVTGDDDVDCWDWFSRQTGRTFRKALIVNCGNGWVERALIERGIIESAVGIDVMPELIADARASAGGLPVDYEVADTNRAEFPDGFDLVVNYAAFHHIAYLDRVLRRCCELLPEDGVLVNWDYVGPHRNQYGYEAWSQVHRVNEQLPEGVRQDLVYPHLPTMLVADPTEAVHSELILPITRRYFDIDVYGSIGGAIAYPLLTHNQAMADASPEERSRWIAHVLAADERWAGGDLFAFYYGHPRKAALQGTAVLESWRIEEEEREQGGASNGGKYYELSLLQDLTQRLSDAEVARDHVRISLEEAQAENAQLRNEIERLQNQSAAMAASMVLRRRAPRLHGAIRSLVRRPSEPPA